jgi:hypothetical protein
MLVRRAMVKAHMMALMADGRPRLTSVSSSSSETHGRLRYTKSGYIQSVKDAWMALQYHFQEGNHRDAQLVGQNPIHSYQFFLYCFDDDPIPQPNESFTILSGIFSYYQFSVNTEGLMYHRLRSCLCLPCKKDLMAGTLDWSGIPHNVPSCEATASKGIDVYTFL